MDALDSANGCVILGTRSPTNYQAPITAHRIAAGATFLSDPIEVPAGYHYCTFDLRASPTGTGTLTVKLRSANAVERSEENGSPLTMADRGITSPTNFSGISAPARAVVSHDPDSNWLQLEVSAAGCDFDVIAVGGIK